ncbi:MAG: transposase, partial [Gammaproteobacteria bacterium]|nr:transposase [Gammaproteobacteria bacterium]
EPGLVAEALERIGQLYAVERKIAEEQLTGEAKLKHREERCKPIVEAFFDWCEERLQDQGLLPTNPFTKA